MAVSALAGIKVSDFADDHGLIVVSAQVSTDNEVWRETTGGWVKARYVRPKICIQSRNPTKEYFISDVVVTID
ncbi:MAG: Phage-tail 3 protein [Candidatus Brocadiaceae bacterium]|nr:Phage-tail 3 protein [Candidatus Brocadiaceae bacterium]